MEEIKLDLTKVYNLIKIFEDGSQEIKIQKGYLSNTWHPAGVVKVDSCVCLETLSEWWRTSLVTGIEKTGKGIMFETMNSTYTLEEA